MSQFGPGPDTGAVIRERKVREAPRKATKREQRSEPASCVELCGIVA